MRKILIIAWVVMLSIHAQAQTTDAVNSVKISGYALGQYQATLKDDDNANSFAVRMVRVSLGGRVLTDFEYKVQAQINGNTSTLGNSPRIVDMYVEWQKYGCFKVKAGEFKRPFTFENPMNPIDQGFMAYGQCVNKLSGFNDRTGEHASNGRDIGVQLQGDIKFGKGSTPYIHYQIGLFNGQGINEKDVDNRKDIIGGAWIVPFDGFRIGAFGWVGSHARDGSWTDEEGTEHSGVVSLGQYRYAISAEYKHDDWQIRSEYIHSTGYAFKTTYQNSDDKADATVNYALGNKADGAYVLCIAPLIKGKLRAKARYDLYRKSASWSTAKTQYEAGINYLFHKNLEIQTEYALINDRSLSKHNYSMIDVEICFRF